MDRGYTIGQLAHAVGVPLSTLRYYERAGLLQPTGRSQNNYRFYTREALQSVRFIRAAQAMGFTLDDVRTVLAFQSGQTALCKDVQPLIAARLADVSQRLKDLQYLQHVLATMLALCQVQEQHAPCHVIDRLTATLP